MKKKSIFIIVILLAVCVGAAALLAFRPTADVEPVAEISASPETRAEAAVGAVTAPETVTVMINKDGVMAMGGVEGEGELKDDRDQYQKPSETPETGAEPTPTPVPVPEEPEKCSYELFSAMSPEQKDEFMHSFESMDAFYDWVVAAQAEYKSTHTETLIGPDGSIDLSKHE